MVGAATFSLSMKEKVFLFNKTHISGDASNFPMIHKLTLGHFNVEALKNGRLVVLRPLDWSVVTRLLQEVGQVDESGHAMLDGHAVEIKEGYIFCPWLMAQRVQTTEEFARWLH